MVGELQYDAVGTWSKIMIKDNKMTVIVFDNPLNRERILDVGVTGGNIFDGFTFKQIKKSIGK